jgi:hypothetical protein
MFGFLEDLANAAVGVVIQTPVAIVADVLTLGGALNDRDDTYTGEAIGKVVDNLNNAVRPK